MARAKTILCTAILATLAVMPAWGQAASGARPTGQAAAAQTGTQSNGHSDAYYYFTLGHLQELQFQNEYQLTGKMDSASLAIDSYKKALEIEPDSPSIMERLAEVYAASQRIRDAVTEAQAALKADPNNLAAHKLLARIYVRALGDTAPSEAQASTIQKAVDELQAVLKLEPDDAESGLWLSRLYRFENKPADAERVLRGVLQRAPDEGQALEQLSQLLIDEGRTQEAIDLLGNAAEQFSSPDIEDLLGDAYSQSKQYDKAEGAYQKAVDMDPDDPGHRHGLADTLLTENKFAAALEQYKKLAQLEPGTAENYLRMSQLYRQLAQYNDAEASLMRAKQLAPGNVEILYNEALLYEDQGRFDDAVRVLTDAIAGTKKPVSGAASPNALAILYEQLGAAYRKAKKYPAAIDTYAEMGKLGDKAAKRAQTLTIETYREAHDLDRAIAEAKKALASSPNDAALTVALANLYGDKGDGATATTLLKGLLHGNNADQQVYLTIAQVQQHSKKFADAEQSAAKAEELAQEPDEKQSAWYMLGAIYEREKKFDQAEAQFRKVLENDPNNPNVLNYFGYMLADRGVRLDEATSMIKKAVDQEPNNGAYLDSLGWVYYKQNKLSEAEDYLKKAIVLEGSDPTILGHLGAVYLKMGQNQQAADVLEKSLAEWQKAAPADYEAEKANEVDTQLKALKRHLAQKPASDTPKPQ